MDAGLANLDTLKRHLLSARHTELNQWDQTIRELGLGVACHFGVHCNRQFPRAVGDEIRTNGDRDHVTLPRYPIEAVTGLEIRHNYQDGFETLVPADDIYQLRLDRGIIEFGSELGDHLSELKIVYTGGYWYRIAEPTDDNYATDTKPLAATAVPDDLLFAWLIQCGHAWDSRDKHGSSTTQEPGKTSALGKYELVPAVSQILEKYKRYASL